MKKALDGLWERSWMHLNKNKAQRKDTWQVNTLSLTTNIIERITENERKYKKILRS